MKTKRNALSIQFVTKELVMRSIGWNELQYGHFQFEMGLEYLNRYCCGDEAIVSQYGKHPLFWKWYRNHWHNRDADFLRDTKGLSQSEKVMQYRDLHNMKGFRYKPHRVVMEMSIYDAVIYPSTHAKEVLV